MKAMTSGQDYAVKFLGSRGFKFISSEKQIERGNLIFSAPNGEHWAIFRNSGYIRKAQPDADRWAVVHRELPAQYHGGGNISDDQYMDLAEMVSMKYSKAEANEKRRKDPETLAKKVERESKARIKDLFDFICRQIEEPGRTGYYPAPPKNHDEILKVVEKLVDKYMY
jgi:hypothetical protein